MVDHRLLFIAGMGRSGTTALRDLLSSHPEIALGVERYKQLYLRRPSSVTEAMFERERFFDFTDGFTNLRPDAHPRWANLYATLEAKWDSASYVGDKMTAIRMQQVWSGLPGAHFVCIVRDIDEVAASWDARAKNPADTGWASEAGARMAVNQWNKALRRIRRAVKQRPTHAVVVEHRRLYGDPSGAAVDRLTEWLGLERATETRVQFERTHTNYVETVAAKHRALSAEDRAHLDEHADRRLFGQLQGLAL